MKNVTISLDDETHRRARILAAEAGISLSMLVKNYINGLDRELKISSISNVREMPSTFVSALPAKLLPRKLGQLKGEIWYADDWDELPSDMQAMLNGENPDDPLNW